MKPSKCEKHQNYKYMNFCPFCKVLADREDLKKDVESIQRLLHMQRDELDAVRTEFQRGFDIMHRYETALKAIASDRWILGECQIDDFKGLDEKSIAKQALLNVSPESQNIDTSQERVAGNAKCVTHHHACDCRGAMFTDLQDEVGRLREALEDAKEALMDGSGAGVFWRESAVERINKALQTPPESADEIQPQACEHCGKTDCILWGKHCSKACAIAAPNSPQEPGNT